MHASPSCSRCAGALARDHAAELISVATIMGRPPLALCTACEDAGAHPIDNAGTGIGTNAISRNAAMRGAGISSAPRPLPAWPATWPQRAIRDLAVFQGEPLAKARQLAQKLREHGTIAILGDRGRGKTVLATWLAQERRQRHLSPGLYVRAHDLFATIRRAWHPQSQEDEWTVLERYRRAALLVIDEFQERSESEWENRTLVNILDHRHASILPTLLIANLSPTAFTTAIGPTLADRIAQTGGLVECTWGNLRTHGG